MAPTPVQQAALSQLAAVPGVVGSMVFDASGAVALAQFPPRFDDGSLRGLAARLASDAYFLEWMAGEQAVLDLRFGDGHVVVRALERAWLLVLCTVQVNAQLLSMSLTQVLRRLRLEPTGELPLPAAPAAPARKPEPTVSDRLRALVKAELGPSGAAGARHPRRRRDRPEGAGARRRRRREADAALHLEEEGGGARPQDARDPRGLAVVTERKR